MKRTTHRALSAVSALALAGALAGPAAAQQTPRSPGVRLSGAHVPGSMGIPQPEPLITLSIQNRSLSRVLYELFKQTPYEYRVVAELGPTVYSLEANKEPLSQVLRKLLAQDKSQEPLVFSFLKSPLSGGGTFTIDREYLEIGVIEGENRVSVANGRVTQVLPRIFQLMQVKYRVEPDVPPVLLSLQLRPNRWEQALGPVLLDAHKQEPGLTYSQDGDTYVVHLHKTPTGVTPAGQAVPGLNPRRVTMSVVNASLRDALAQLFKGSEWKYQVSDAVKDVNVTFSSAGLPELVALQDLLRQAGASRAPVTYREGKGILYIEPGLLPGQVLISGRGQPQAVRTTSLAPNQQKISEVLKFLAQATGSTVRLAPNVPDLPVTFRVQDATIEEALRALVQAGRASLPNLTFRMGEDQSYVIELGG